MNLFKKLFTASLLIVALVMSVAVMGKVKVKATVYSNKETTFTSSTIPNGWSMTGNTFNNSYYKMEEGATVSVTAETLFGTENLSTSIVVEPKIATFGSWSNPKNVKIIVELLDSSLNVLSTNNTTSNTLPNAVAYGQGSVTVNKPTNESQIASMRITFDNFNTTSSGCLRFAGVKLTYTTIGTTPSVDLSGNENVKIGTTYNYSATPTNIDEPHTISFTSSNTKVATITNEGVLTPVAMGSTNITATINGTTSSELEVKVWPDNSTNISVSTARAVATQAGTSDSPFTYATIGRIKSITNDNTFVLKDGESANDSIDIFKFNHGFKDGDLGTKLKITGQLKTYSSSPEYAVSSIDSLYTVSFNSNGGSEVDSQEVLSGEKIVEPTDPTKADNVFAGWFKEPGLLNEWDFNNDVVTADTTLYAKWLSSFTSLFESLSTKAKIKVSYSSSSTFELFSGEIVEGDYVIYYDGKMMNTTVSNNRLQYEEVTPENGIITDQVPSSCIWHIAKSGSYWTLYNAKDNKYAASTGTKNQAQMLDDGSDDKALWAISGTSTYEFVNKANDSAGINKNLRNNGTYGFACYGTSTGGALTLYKLNESITIKQEYSKNDLSLQFAGLIDKELKDQLDASGSNVTYGMFYCKTSNISTTLVDDLSSSLNDPSPLSLSELEELGYYSTSIASNSVVGTDASGMNEVLNNPSYYIYAVSINHIDDANINTSISAVAYVCIDGVYSFMAEKQCSVKSLAAEYLSLPDKSSFNGHLGVLAYLAN